MSVYERIHNLANDYNTSFDSIMLYVFNCWVKDVSTPKQRLEYLENDCKRIKRIKMKEKILQWCKTLAKSQGLYGRLLETLENNEDALNELAKNQFNDIVDFVMFIES